MNQTQLVQKPAPSSLTTLGIIAAGVVIPVSSVQAQEITLVETCESFSLQQLYQQDTNIICGDKKFFNFSQILNQVNNQPSNPLVNPTNVGIIFGTFSDGNIGLKYNWDGEMSLLNADNTPDFRDYILSYNVMTVDGKPRITDNHLEISNISTKGNPLLSVREVVDGGEGIGFIGEKMTDINNTMDFLLFDPVTMLEVTTSFHLEASAQDDSVDLGMTVQTFSQTTTPEPRSILGILALSGLGLDLRRKKDRA